MATRQKTIQHAFSPLASVTNNTLTNFTQTTVYIPESSVTFRSVVATVTFDNKITATAPTVTTKNLGLRLAAVAYSTISNSVQWGAAPAAHAASFAVTGDYTSYFNTNWTGTSMTCDFQVQINQTTGTPADMVNACCTLEITYDYDDTSTTQIKTVMIPLDASVTTMATSDTTYDTIPALGYYLAEPSKTFRNIFVVLQGNTQVAGSATGHTITIHVGTATTTTASYEGANNMDRFYRYVWELSGSWPSTTATQAFQLSNTAAHNNHIQAWLVVTYEFKADNATTTLTSGVDDATTTIPVTAASNLGTAPYLICIDNEQMLVTSVASNNLTVTRGYNSTTNVAHSNAATVTPCATNSIQLSGNGLAVSVGGITNAEYQRFTNRFYIEEPGPITGNKIAFYATWFSSTPITGFNARVGTGGFVTYTDAATLIGGNNALMCRNDSAFTFVRGLNTLTFDIYSTQARKASGVNGHWVLTYVSSKSSAGYGAHNQTRRYYVATVGTGAGTSITTAAAPPVPESDYFLSNVGVKLLEMSSVTAGPHSTTQLRVERLSAEGGIRLDTVHSSYIDTDARLGIGITNADISHLMKRWPADTGFERMDLETSRRYVIDGPSAAFSSLAVWYTYHACGPFTVSGSVTGSSGGVVDVGLHRASDGELLKATTVTGNSAFSFDWWDNTENVFVEASESNTRLGRSASGIGAGDP